MTITVNVKMEKNKHKNLQLECHLTFVGAGYQHTCLFNGEDIFCFGFQVFCLFTCIAPALSTTIEGNTF